MRSNGAKPFIKWVGGKGQLISKIDTNLPAQFTHYDTYVEPFVGGGAVLFYILQNYDNIKTAVINDINSDLITTYRVVRDNSVELIAELEIIEKEFHVLATEEERTEYYLKKREIFNSKKLNPITNSACFIFLNKTCFNGLYRVNSRGGFNVPYGKYVKPVICDKSTILADSKLLQRVEILNGDFNQTIEFATEGALFYCDPPYKPISTTSSFNSYSKEAFNDSEQARLKNFCDTISDRGAMLLQSNSDPSDDYFDNLYSSYRIERVLASRMVNSDGAKRGKITELMITNYIDTNTTQLSLF